MNLSVLFDILLLAAGVFSVILVHNPISIGVCIGAVLLCGWDVWKARAPKKAAAPKVVYAVPGVKDETISIDEAREHGMIIPDHEGSTVMVFTNQSKVFEDQIPLGK